MSSAASPSTVSFARASVAAPGRPRRWEYFALLIFPLGYMVTQPVYPQLEYAALNVLGGLAMLVLLSRLQGDPVMDMPGLIVLVVFVFGYYFKFYAIGWTIASDAPWAFDPAIEGAARTPSNALDSFRMLTYGFITCSLTWVALRRPARGAADVSVTEEVTPTRQAAVRRLFIVASIVLVVVMVVTGFAQFVTGVGVMGSENDPLPYHLAGIIFHPREKTIPVVVVFLAWLSWCYRRPRWAAVALLMLAAHALVQSFLQASRGQLVYAFLPVFMLLFVRRQITRRHVLWFGLMLGAAALLHPLITALRILRMFGEPLTLETLRNAQQGIQVVVGEQKMNVALAGLVAIAGRVSGTDTLVLCTQWSYPTFLSLDSIQHFLFGPSGLARMMTLDVAGYTSDVITIAPTLVGAGVVFGGASGVILLCVAWTWFMTRLLDWVAARRWRVTQLAWAFVAAWAFFQTGEFVVLSDTHFPIFWGGGLVLCEWLMRRYIPSPAASRGSSA